MPQGLDKFVKRQELSNGEAFPAAVDLVQRREIGLSAKVKSRLEFRGPTSFQALPNLEPAPTYAQSSRSYDQNDEGLFRDSVLDDSDDTTRNLDRVGEHGYQLVKHPEGEWNFNSGAAVEPDSDLRNSNDYEEGGNDYATDIGGVGDDQDEEDSRLESFQYLSGGVQMRGLSIKTVQERALQLRDSQRYADAQSIYNSKVGLKDLPSTHPGISGRFATAAKQGGDVRKFNLPPNGVTGAPHEAHSYDNSVLFSDDFPRSRNDSHIHQGSFQVGGLDFGGHTERNDAMTEQDLNGRQQTDDRFNGSAPEGYSSGSNQSSPTEHTPRGDKRREKQIPISSHPNKRKNTIVELDYEIDKLSTIKYSELKDQPFDNNPRALESVIPESLTGPKVSLDDCLEHFRGQEPVRQVKFFAQMPIDQWEQSGDWFLCRFGDIMSKLRDARHAKRDVSTAFEEKLAEREKAIRGKSEGIQEVLRQMRAGGEGVLRGRAP